MKIEPKPNTRRVKCVQCGKRKSATTPKNCQIKDHKALLKADPFCSRVCAEAFHELVQRPWGQLAV